MTAGQVQTNGGGGGALMVGQSPIPRMELVGSTVDASCDSLWFKALTADTQIQVANLTRGAQVWIEVTGDFALTFASPVRVLRGCYDGSGGKTNTIWLRVVESETGPGVSPIVEAEITTVAPQLTGLVSRQVNGSFFATETEALDTPAATPATANLYSLMGRVDEMRSPDDGLFHFRMVVDGAREWRWSQRSNPLEHWESVTDYTEKQAIGGFNTLSFGGLSRSSYAGTVLDAQPGVRPTVAPINGMYGGIGTLAIVGNANPIFLPGDAGVFLAASVELYAEPSGA